MALIIILLNIQHSRESAPYSSTLTDFRLSLLHLTSISHYFPEEQTLRSAAISVDCQKLNGKALHRYIIDIKTQRNPKDTVFYITELF
jgi:hypothetical protein